MRTIVKPGAQLTLYIPVEFLDVLKHVGILTGDRPASAVARDALAWWVKHNPDVRQMCEQFNSRITEYDSLSPKALRNRRLMAAMDAQIRRERAQNGTPTDFPVSATGQKAWADRRAAVAAAKAERAAKEAAVAHAAAALEVPPDVPDTLDGPRAALALLAVPPADGAVDEQAAAAIAMAQDPVAPPLEEPPMLTAADLEPEPVRVVHRRPRKRDVISTGPTIAETMQAREPEAPFTDAPKPEREIPTSTARLMPQHGGPETPQVMQVVQEQHETAGDAGDAAPATTPAVEPELPKRRTLRFRPVGVVPPPEPSEPEAPFAGF